jgi:putative ABC transport system substrate-binding protein
MRPIRRRLLFAAAALAAAPRARAQMPTGKRTLGVLSPHPKPTPERLARSPYYGRLAELGWRLNENLVLERPEHPEGEAALPQLAAELVSKRVDVILAIGPEAAVAAARATRTIPIVFCCVAYAVEQGLVHSYANPGGNVTGVALWTGPELATKLLQIYREIAPDVRRVAAISTPSSVSAVAGGSYREAQSVIRAAARSVGFDYQGHEIATAGDLDRVFDDVRQSGAQGLLTYATTTARRLRHRIADFANRIRLPHASTQADFVEAGALFSYGADMVRTVVQSFEYAGKVLSGANPAELPVERPAAYELVVNLRTAAGLGLQVPASILLRADRVIE